MNNVNYGLSGEEKAIISENVGGLVADMRDEIVTPQEFKDIARVLQVNQDNFEKFKAETWFKKSWLVISGRKGKLTDISINNLGKVQLGVLKLLGEIMEDSSGIKDDLLMVFSRLEQFQLQSIELKTVILKFNQKYDKRFQRLQKEVEETRKSLSLTQMAMGLGCVAGATLVFVPGLQEQYWQYGAAGGGATGAFLLGQVALGTVKRKKKPIPVVTAKKLEMAPGTESAITQACQFLRLKEAPEEELKDTRVFKIDSLINDLMGYFTLSGEEQRLLFSLQYYLASVDRGATADHELKKKKAEWLEAWQQTIEEQLDGPLVTDSDVLFMGLDEVRQEHLPLPKLGTILFEASLFIPYFSLGSQSNDGVLLYDQIDHQDQITKLCRQLGFSHHLIEAAMKVNDEALKEIPKKGFFEIIWDTVKDNPYKVLAGAVLIALTGGLAAPLLGSAIGAAMGLSGVVAVNAGLAFLGGGAIAAGGFGMAGGTAVLIGGGAILGASVTGGLVNLFSSSSHLVLREVAKMEAISKVFLSSLKDGKNVIELIIEKQEKTRDSLALAALEALAEDDTDKKKELDEGERFSSKAIERLESFVDENY